MSAATAGSADTASAAALNSSLFITFPRYATAPFLQQLGLNLVASRQCRNFDLVPGSAPCKKILVPQPRRGQPVVICRADRGCGSRLGLKNDPGPASADYRDIFSSSGNGS